MSSSAWTSKPDRLADRGQSVDVATAAGSEVEVLAHHDRLRVQGCGRTPRRTKTSAGGVAARSSSNEIDVGVVDSLCLDQLELLLERGEQQCAPFSGRTTWAGCPSNVTTAEATPSRSAAARTWRKISWWPEMDTVEHADRGRDRRRRREGDRGGRGGVPCVLDGGRYRKRYRGMTTGRFRPVAMRLRTPRGALHRRRRLSAHGPGAGDTERPRPAECARGRSPMAVSASTVADSRCRTTAARTGKRVGASIEPAWSRVEATDRGAPQRTQVGTAPRAPSPRSAASERMYVPDEQSTDTAVDERFAGDRLDVEAI